ncbi:MAG TPA: hypothetical protein VL123_05235 [Candidatus Udaeobacter sp.]|jgi:anti-sigma factor RsiW|nr:hypothetical protein [Candidatus Udaeobacter sp.]
MNCVDLDRWLDQGAPDSLEAATRAHAGSCPRCAAEIARMSEIDRALASFHAPAPSGFTSGVMRRVAAFPRRPILWAPAPPVAWWVRVAADPAAALALLLAGLILLGDGALTRMATVLAQGLVEGAKDLLAAGPSALSTVPAALGLRGAFAAPSAALALALTLLPGLLWGSWRLFGWIERAFSRHSHLRPRRLPASATFRH